jgi:hypothetical protein
MDQDEGAGHHAITREAVQELFASGRADADGRINGMTEEEYFQALDQGQEHQDRWYGPTIDPGWLNPDAQREHGMADPYLSGEENRIIDREYVESELYAARDGDEMAHLGNAVHALEDSYSEAHAFRGDSVNEGDPTAPIESFNVFDPLPNPSIGTWGKLGDEQGTHDERFDDVPLDADGELVRGSDMAGAHAVAQMLGAYEDNRAQPDSVAHGAIDGTVDRFYQAGEGGTDLNDEATDEWRAERDARLEVHREEMVEAGLEPPDETSWYDSAGQWVAETATAAGDTIVEGATVVGDTVSDGVTAVGEGISDAADAATEYVSEIFE